MPVHLGSCSRRRFLSTTIAAGAGALVLPARTWADDAARADRWALLADTHIAANPAQENRGVVMADNLRRVLAEVAARQPAGVLLAGDCALQKGLAGDYTMLARLLVPMAMADLPVHLMMGNHDDRGTVRTALAASLPRRPVVEGKFASIVETPRANWFLLDTLDRTAATPGKIGAAQLAWLAAALDQMTQKPAIIIGHHNPMFDTPPERNRSLLDTDELFAVLAPRKQVKAYFFGHTHHWNVTQRHGIHLVNLPPVAYLFLAGDPNGWVDIELADAGATLMLNTLDKKHPQSGKRVELQWRAA